ncbi:Uncharacterized conserved protein [Plasmopara halstedii]|uniref:Uncharacterized conserved protein n=1 Tax=Plasmopara halstedii TaxID=4781 RepID=A0A0P1B5K8_PLAHL|nr:Uncharacterized conserved protein [Plasmopara halstedii]CEG50104.1 Uncharacterized conserved protein [Plasmopara halstedii]|eukprot:XP_024586473.1 Uncharacterized conserved protein [Plasmopara halstedii]
MEAPVPITVVPPQDNPSRVLDLHDIMDELPMLASLKEQKWMARLPRNIFYKLKKDSHDSDGSDSALLSPDFLPTPRTARALSVLVPQPNEEVLEALDARYFTASFDPVAHMLEHMPESKNELDVFLRTEISAVDIAKDVIVTKLQDEVRANYSALVQGMKVVQDVDLDLVRAHVHVKNGRRLLATAKSNLILSSLEIVKTKRNRDRVCEIIYLGSQIVQLLSDMKEMNLAFQEHRFISAVDICVDLRKRLSRKELEGVSILRDIRPQLQDFIPLLRAQFDHSLRKVAEKFDLFEYKELLQAYITLADHSENLGFEFSSITLNDVLSKIPDIIVRSIDDMTVECMHQVFEPKSLEKYRPDIKNVKRLYERLTDLMHTYYLLVQWHRDPFNSLSDDIAYLHRCGIDDDDDNDDDSDEEDSHDEKKNNCGHSCKLSIVTTTLPEAASQRLRKSTLGHSGYLYDQVLCDTGMNLLKYRKIVWENIQHNVLEMFEKLDFTNEYKMEHVIALSHATSAFTEIGEEFTGTPSSKIRSVVRIKCEQYLHEVHNDNIELARMLFEAENWTRVTASKAAGDDNTSILRLIEIRSGYVFKRKIPGDSTSGPIHSRRVFPSFYNEGNPFSASNSIEWLTMKQGIRFDHEIDAIGDKVSPCLTSNQDTFPINPSESDFVLTSSSLAGFVRLCGVHLKMMEHLPHTAWDIFRSLNHLFEFNLYATFTSFFSADDAAKFLQGICGFDKLRAGICRIADDMNNGEILLRASAVILPFDKAEKGQQLDSPQSRKVTLRKVIRTPTAVKYADVDNLYALAERSIACEAIVGQSRLLDAMEDLARSYLPTRYHCLMDEMYERNRFMARELRDFMYSTIAVRLVDIPALVTSVSAVSWNISYISNQHNEYIVHLVQKCGEAWGSLQILADGSIPYDARVDIWLEMVQTIMDTLLQAFSTISKPTPQGRALMLLDLHALQNGVDLINDVSSRALPRGRAHVGNYIKAFYYDEDELLRWIQTNKKLYTRVQFANLLKNGIGSTLETSKLRELVLKVDTIITT